MRQNFFKYAKAILETKNISVDSVKGMSDNEIEAMKLPVAIKQYMRELKARDGMSAEDIANKIADMMEASSAPVVEAPVVEPLTEEPVIQFPEDEAQTEEPIINNVEVQDEEKVAETVVLSEEPEKEETTEEVEMTADEVRVVLSTMTTKSVAAMTKQFKEAIGERKFNQNVVKQEISARVKFNKSKARK